MVLCGIWHDFGPFCSQSCSHDCLQEFFFGGGVGDARQVVLNLPVGYYDATEIESRPFLAARMVMAEADFYQPIKKGLEELLASKGKSFYLEVTATRRWSEKLKGKIPQGREIVFTFLKKRPDLLGFVEGQHSSNFITVEVKEQIKELDDIYQAKLYKEVFDAKYGFLITTEPIPGNKTSLQQHLQYFAFCNR